MNLELLDSLFVRYGYEIKESKDEYRVYLSRNGMFYGAEIVVLKSVDSNAIASNYSQLGYSCNIHNFVSIEEAEKYLFDVFFKTSQTFGHIKKRYQNFANAQVRNLNNPNIKYEYIDIPFVKETDESTNKGINLLQSITDIFKCNGACLIVVEAPSGLGKTATAFELYKSLESSSNDIRPIFTELSRNRDARRFKYVLWDEIESEFNSVLNAGIVIHNIKKGRVPLIVDGFDDLMYRSVSSTKERNENSDSKEVAAMLSVIGGLLHENAKIILTSHKSSIFEGEYFQNWVNSYQQLFKVVRFRLEKPEIKDWLSDEKIDILNNKNISFETLSNPVLLTWLRQLSDADFARIIENQESIVDNYFSSLLTEEMKRKNLIITEEDLMAIYQNLAMSFVKYNITSECRSFIKDLIVEESRNILLHYRERMPQKTNIDEMANTLINHPFLNRVGNKGSVGFTNDFVFGILFGKYLLKNGVSFLANESYLPEDLFEKTTSAFCYASQKERQNLSNILSQK